MSKGLGVTTARVLRKDFDVGLKLAKAANAQSLAKFSQWHSLTRVVLPGKTNGVYLVEMRMSQLETLIQNEREHGAELAEKKFKVKLSKKTEQTKALKRHIKSQDEQIYSLDDSVSKNQARVEKLKLRLSTKVNEHKALFEEFRMLPDGCEKRDQKNRELSKTVVIRDDKIQEQRGLIQELERQNAVMRQKIIDLNSQVGNPAELESFPTSSTVTEKSIAKVYSNRPFSGPYGANQ